MKINQFSQQGKRSNNEDSIGYSEGLFTVCDGMGGHVSGERASAFVVQALLQAFEQSKPLGKMEIQQQLNKVQTDLNQLLEKEPELEKMGTTFTGVFITPDVWYAAHIGDSRIYLFRPSEQKLWHTWDHSLVGELMRTKEITVEAGRFHPMSNRIAKAIIAQKDGKPSSASVVKIDELKAGDIFLLCSDGVVEGWGDFELVQLFADTSLSFDQKCKKLAQQCNEKSKDNNTALIVEIEEGDAFSFGNNAELEWTTFAEVEADYKQYLADNAEESEPKQEEAPSASPEAARMPKSQEEPHYEPEPTGHVGGHNKKPILIISVVVLLLIGLGLFFILRGGGNDKAKANVDEPKREGQTDIRVNQPGKHDPNTLLTGSDAEEAARKSEALEAENRAYNSIQSIEDCESFLRAYPNSQLAEAVKQKKMDFKDDETFEKCKTIKDCDYYLAQFKDGRHVIEVRQLKSELEKEDAAFKKCTTIEGCDAYLQDYPQGRYVKEVSRKRDELQKQPANASTSTKTNEGTGAKTDVTNSEELQKEEPNVDPEKEPDKKPVEEPEN